MEGTGESPNEYLALVGTHGPCLQPISITSMTEHAAHQQSTVLYITSLSTALLTVSHRDKIKIARMYLIQTSKALKH